MKFKKLKSLILAGMISTSVLVPSIANAQYITAYEKVVYDRYVVDTASFFYPDKDDKYNKFNCIVWHFVSDTDKGSPFTFKFKFDNNKWYIHETTKDKSHWVVVENNSVASDVLRVCLPYLGTNQN
jgi:hypothetical protein